MVHWSHMCAFPRSSSLWRVWLRCAMDFGGERRGAWVQDLPPSFQWLGLSQAAYPFMAMSSVLFLVVLLGWGLRNSGAGRAVYATGSNPEAARLAGFDTPSVTFSVFVITGTLTGFAAVLNSVRFNQIPSNTGIGLEMRVVAAIGENFLTVGNFFEVLRFSIELGLLAVAMTPVLVTGGIDLSVGSMMGLAAVVFGAMWRDWNWPIPAAAFVALLLGFAGGSLN